MKAYLTSYQINGHSAQGYLVKPEGYSPERGEAESKGGVVVIQEWWGLNDHIKDVAKRVAELGYVVIAPDLYDGKVATDAWKKVKAWLEKYLK